MRKIEINSLDELCNMVYKLNKDKEYWFRGQNNAEYSLLPSAYRELILHQDYYNRPINPRIVHLAQIPKRGQVLFIPAELYLESFMGELKRIGNPCISRISRMNRIEKFCYAQHYGVKTPMLDWTTDFSVACFFSTDGREKGRKSAIFMLNPQKWNERSIIQYKGIPEVVQLSEEPYLTPIAFLAPKTNERICRQSGNFTLHGREVGPLEQYVNDDADFLIKLELSDKVASELSCYLSAFGIDEKSIYVGEKGEDARDKVSISLKDVNEESLKRKVEEFKREWENTRVEDRGIDNPISLYCITHDSENEISEL